MRRGLLVVSLIVIGLLAFYVAWPAWSARQIRHALEAGDAAALESRIDFPRVRDSVRPVVAAEVARSVEKLQKDAGPLGAAIAGTLSKGLTGQLADAAVNSILTPANVIRMVRDGTDLRRAIYSVTGRDAKGARGGAAGGVEQTGTPTPPAPGTTPNAGQPGRDGDAKADRRLTLANIKSYRITGPFSLAVAIARDHTAERPDVTAEMAFTGWAWKVVGLMPHL